MSSIINYLTRKQFLKPSEHSNLLAVTFRVLSMPVVFLSWRLGIHPNVITTLSLVAALISGYYYHQITYVPFFILWTISIALDYSDGALARLSGKESYAGYLFDMLTDRIKLVYIVAIWALQEANCLATVYLVILVTIMFSLEIFTHLFIAFRPAPKPSQSNIISSIHATFLSFDMHSYFLLGCCLLFGGWWAWIGTSWLLLILAYTFLIELKKRTLGPKGEVVKFNTNLFKRLFRTRQTK